MTAPPTLPDPDTYTAALDALLSTRLPLLLEMRAEQDRLDVGIKAEPGYLRMVARALHGRVPDWGLDATDPPVRRGRTCFVGWLDRPEPVWWAPLRVSSNGVDAVGALIEAVQPLASDEQLLIRFLVRPARRELRLLLHLEITVPATPKNAIDEMARLAYGDDWAQRVPRFEPRRQRLFEERLRQPAFEVQPIIALRGGSRARLHARARSVENVFRSLPNASFGGFQVTVWGWGATPRTLPTSWPAGLDGTFITTPELATLWHPASSLVHAAGVRYVTRPTIALPRDATSGAGIVLGARRHRGEQQLVCVPIDDLRAGPFVMLGRTGTGKSTLMGQVLRQLIERPEHPGVVLLDPNQDLAHDICRSCIPAAREAQAHLFELGDIEHPIALPFFTPPPHVDIDTFVASTFTAIKLIFKEQWSETRLEDLTYAIVATLCRTDGATLLDVPRLLTEAAYRRRTIAPLTDPVTRDFWREWELMSDGARREASRPVLYRLRSFFRAPAVRNLICRSEPGPDFTALLGSGGILLFSLAGDAITAESDVLGELLISRLHLTLQRRLGLTREQRRPTVLAIDESQRFTGAALPILLREGRKLGLTLMLATQYCDAWGQTLAESVLGNAGTLASFRLGPSDSRKLAASLKPFTPDDLENLDRHEAVVKLQLDGRTLPALDLRTVPPNQDADHARLERIRTRTRTQFARPRTEVEAIWRDSPAGAAPAQGIDIDED